VRSYRAQKSEQWEDRDTHEMSNRWRLATRGAELTRTILTVGR
jgi:hypothetical protein